jgi:hypothetical protein
MENRDSQQNKIFPMALTTGQAQHGGKPTKQGMTIDPALRSMQQRLGRDKAAPIPSLPFHCDYNITMDWSGYTTG